MSLKDLLVRARLIEAENGDAASETDFSSGAPELAGSENVVPSEPTPSVSGTPAAGVAAGIALDSIYAAAGVPSSAYPAERVLKILDGLAAMDSATKRAAIAAMDAADDTWTVDDVIGDAARKATALRGHVDQLSRQIGDAQQLESTQKASLTKDYDDLCASIDAQIAQLREAAQLAASEHTKAIATLAERTATAIATCKSEQSRVQAEIDRLDGLARELRRPQA